jgi:hypothetical protein
MRREEIKFSWLYNIDILPALRLYVTILIMPMHDDTQDYLILYYFNETEMTDSVLIQKEIDYCPHTEEAYSHLVTVFEKVDEALFSASEKSIQKVLAMA